MVNNKIKVGMVGISFGMEFIPIYMKHPDVYEIAIADTNLELIKTAQEKFGISSKDCYDNYDDMLKILEDISPDEYSLGEWNSAVQYLLREEIVLESPRKAREYLMEILRNRG